MHPSYMHLVLFLAGEAAVSGVGAINNPAVTQLNTCNNKYKCLQQILIPHKYKTQNPYTPPYC